jgi:Ca-activated chloride channel family protein
MIGFSWGLALLGLVLIPALLWWYARSILRPGGGIAMHTDLEFLQSLKPARFARNRDLGALFFTLALGLGVVALARPNAPVPVLDNRTTVMMAVDVSGSMRNNDIAPSRFEAMQKAAKEFARKLPAGINLGLVSFAGTAAVNVQPTLERQPILDAIDGMFMSRGTAIGAGLRESISVLPGRTTDEKATKPLETNPPPAIVVLLTDGRNNRDVDPIQMAQLAKTQQVRVYTIGLGTLASNQSGNYFQGFDPTVLQEMARITDGQYFEATSASKLEQAYSKLGSSLGWTVKRGEVTHVVAACAGVLLFLALLIGERSRRVV